MTIQFLRRGLAAGLLGLLAAGAGAAERPSDLDWPDTPEKAAAQTLVGQFNEVKEVLKTRDGQFRGVSLTGRGTNERASMTIAVDPETGLVQEIKGNGVGVTNDQFAWFVPFSELRVLSLHHNSDKSLSKDELREVCDGAGLAKLKGNAALEEVMLPGGPFDADGLRAVAELTQLKRLGAWHVWASGEDFAALRNHPGLESVRLGQTWNPTFADTLLEILSTCPNMTRISLGEGYVTWEGGLQHLTKLKGTLETLELRSAVVAPEDLERIKQAMPGVEVKHEGMAAVGQKIASNYKGANKKLTGAVPQELLDRYVAAAKEAE